MQKAAVPDAFFDIAAYVDAPYGFAAEFDHAIGGNCIGGAGNFAMALEIAASA